MYLIKSYFYDNGQVEFYVQKDVKKNMPEEHTSIETKIADIYFDTYRNKNAARQHVNDLFAEGGRQINFFRW